jgi:hypothetical protein
MLEPAEASPLLRGIQWLDLKDGDVEKTVRRLVEIIRHRNAVEDASVADEPQMRRGMTMPRQEIIAV